MADQNQELIRLWLETNFKEEATKGEEALQAFRAQVQGMGPEVAAELTKIEDNERKLADAAIESAKAAEIQAKAHQGVMQALAETAPVIPPVTREIENLSAASATASINTQALGRGFFDLERAGVALATGRGLTRLGPLFERLIGGIGGPGGLGFGIAGLAFAIELIAPKIEKFWDSWDGSTKAAKDMEELIARVQKLQALKGDDASKAFQDYLPGEDIAGRAAGAIGASGLSAQATPAEIEATKPQYQMTQGGPVQINDTDKAKNAMNERIAKANLQLASEQVEKATKPGEAGKRARAFLKSLARGNPGAFPQGFAEWLESIEETPEEREAAEQAIVDNDPDQQYMERHHAAREQHNADADAFNKGLEKQKKEKAAREELTTANNLAVKFAREKDAADAKAAEKESQERVTADNLATRFARQKDAADTKETGREQAKYAKEHTPEELYKHQRRAQENQIMGYAQNLNSQNVSQGGMPATPEFMHHVAQNAAQQVTMGADIATAVQIAIAQVQQKIAEDFRRNMARQHQTSQSFYAP